MALQDSATARGRSRNEIEMSFIKHARCSPSMSRGQAKAKASLPIHWRAGPLSSVYTAKPGRSSQKYENYEKEPPAKEAHDGQVRRF